MKHKILLPVIAAVAIVGILVFFNNKEAGAPSPRTEQTADVSAEPDNENSPEITSENTLSPAAKGQYLSYSKDLLSKTDGTRILFFHAPWCPQCRQLEADIKSGNIPSNVTIIKVDYDSRQDLRQKYGVTIQTSLVKLDENGNLDKKFVAYDEPTLQNLVDNLLR